jgi:hypothetical protein
VVTAGRDDRVKVALPPSSIMTDDEDLVRWSEDPRLGVWARETALADVVPPRYGSAAYGLALQSIEVEEQQRTELIRQLRDIELSIAKKRTTISIARCLHFEILSTIFSLLECEYPRDATDTFQLMGVSRHWRDALLHTPSVFSRIALCGPDADMGGRTPTEASLSTWISRAKGVPLDITLSTGGLPITSGLKELIKSNAARIGVLGNYRFDYRENDWFLNLLADTINLRHFTCQEFSPPELAHDSVSLPSAKTLHYFYQEPFVVAPQLESLRLHVSPIDASFGVTLGRLLTSHPNLTSLTIEETDLPEDAQTSLGEWVMSQLLSIECNSRAWLLIYILNRSPSIRNVTIPLSALYSGATFPMVVTVERLILTDRSFQKFKPNPYKEFDPKLVATCMSRFPNLKFCQLTIGQADRTWMEREISAFAFLNSLAKVLELKSFNKHKIAEVRCAYWKLHDLSKPKLREAVAKAKKQNTLKMKRETLMPTITIGPTKDCIDNERYFEDRLQWSQFPFFLSLYGPKRGRVS